MKIAGIFAFAALLLMIAYCTHEIRSSCEEIMQRLNIIYGVINGDFRSLVKDDETLINSFRDMNHSYADLMAKQVTILQGVAETLNNISELIQDDEPDEQTYAQTEENNGEEE